MALDDTEELYYQINAHYTTRSGYILYVGVLSQSNHSHNKDFPISFCIQFHYVIRHLLKLWKAARVFRPMANVCCYHT